jgi:hypothetical protein
MFSRLGAARQARPTAETATAGPRRNARRTGPIAHLDQHESRDELNESFNQVARGRGGSTFVL